MALPHGADPHCFDFLSKPQSQQEGRTRSCPEKLTHRTEALPTAQTFYLTCFRTTEVSEGEKNQTRPYSFLVNASKVSQDSGSNLSIP